MMDAHSIAVPRKLENAAALFAAHGQSVAFAAIDGHCVAVIALQDEVRAAAAATVRLLQERGIRVVLLSGDRERAARHVAATVGITDVIGDATPEYKLAAIQHLQAAGCVVAMVGDGLNDGPALAAADIAIAVDSGTDLAMECSDIVLMDNDLAAIERALQLSAATMHTIRGNLGWAFAYNLVAVPFAAVGILSPMYAAGAMACSSLLVIANSLRLRRFRHEAATVEGQCTPTAMPSDIAIMEPHMIPMPTGVEPQELRTRLTSAYPAPSTSTAVSAP